MIRSPTMVNRADSTQQGEAAGSAMLACSRCDGPVGQEDLLDGIAVRIDGQPVCALCIESLPAGLRVQINRVRALKGLAVTTYRVRLSGQPDLGLYTFTNAGLLLLHQRALISGTEFATPDLPADHRMPPPAAPRRPPPRGVSPLLLVGGAGVAVLVGIGILVLASGVGGHPAPPPAPLASAPRTAQPGPQAALSPDPVAEPPAPAHATAIPEPAPVEPIVARTWSQYLELHPTPVEALAAAEADGATAETRERLGDEVVRQCARNLDHASQLLQKNQFDRVQQILDGVKIPAGHPEFAEIIATEDNLRHKLDYQRRQLGDAGLKAPPPPVEPAPVASPASDPPPLATPAPEALAPNPAAQVPALPHSDPLARIPEAKDFQQVFAIDLARLARDPAYDSDTSASLTQPFDRVGYLLELQVPDQPPQYVWTACDAFTKDPRKIAIPALAVDATFQQQVANLTVASNVAGLATGTFPLGGIEFWPNDYRPPNATMVAGASDTGYDFGDTMSELRDGYGSMQVHNPGLGQTVFAINHWSAAGAADIGIGNAPGVNSDWTFTGNAGTYVVKKLRVFVRVAMRPAKGLLAEWSEPFLSKDTAALGLTTDGDIPAPWPSVAVGANERYAKSAYLPGTQKKKTQQLTIGIPAGQVAGGGVGLLLHPNNRKRVGKTLRITREDLPDAPAQDVVFTDDAWQYVAVPLVAGGEPLMRLHLEDVDDLGTTAFWLGPVVLVAGAPPTAAAVELKPATLLTGNVLRDRPTRQRLRDLLVTVAGNRDRKREWNDPKFLSFNEAKFLVNGYSEPLRVTLANKLKARWTHQEILRKQAIEPLNPNPLRVLAASVPAKEQVMTVFIPNGIEASMPVADWEKFVVETSAKALAGEKGRLATIPVWVIGTLDGRPLANPAMWERIRGEEKRWLVIDLTLAAPTSLDDGARLVADAMQTLSYQLRQTVHSSN